MSNTLKESHIYKFSKTDKQGIYFLFTSFVSTFSPILFGEVILLKESKSMLPPCLSGALIHSACTVLLHFSQYNDRHTSALTTLTVSLPLLYQEYCLYPFISKHLYFAILAATVHLPLVPSDTYHFLVKFQHKSPQGLKNLHQELSLINSRLLMVQNSGHD